MVDTDVVFVQEHYPIYSGQKYSTLPSNAFGLHKWLTLPLTENNLKIYI